MDGTWPIEFRPKASNFDGTMVIGKRGNGELVRWTEGVGMELIMPTTTLHAFGAPMCISHDGSVIVGNTPDNYPAIWREGLGVQVLTNSPLDPARQFSARCSEDGQRIDVRDFLHGGYSWDATVGWKSFKEVLEDLGARDLSHVDASVRLGPRSRDGSAMVATFTDSPTFPFNVLQQTIVFLGTPSPGALGANYCGPAEFNSSGFSALLQATGSASIQANSLGMTARFLPPQACGYALISLGSGFAQAPGSSQGNLCLDGGQPVGRHDQAGDVCVANGDGLIEFSIDLSSLPGPTMSYAAQPGETLNFQVWFRDVDSTGLPTSNFTDAVSVTFE